MIPSQGHSSGSEYSYRDTDVRPNTTYYYKLESFSDDGSQVFGPYEFSYRAQFALEQNAPNPFNPTTTIRFTIPEAGHVRLLIYDVAGREVRKLVNERLEANHYEQVWDGKDAIGRTVASGVYFYRLQASKDVKTRKMLMLK